MIHTTIAVVPRDRFSKTAQTIRSILNTISSDTRLVVVDAGSPRRYSLQIERALRGCQKAEILRSDQFVDANAAKNWVVREVPDGDFVAFVENDNLVHAGW